MKSMKYDKPALPIVAITGRSGCGKSTVSDFYREMGYTVIDADRVAAEITNTSQRCIAELVEHFGTDILQGDGTIHRAALAAKAFANLQEQQALSAITHPYIFETIFQAVFEAKNRKETFVFVDGAVIIDYPFQNFCDLLIAVLGCEQKQISRLMLRDGITELQAKKRLSVQTSEERLKEAADYVIDNSGDLETLKEKAVQLLFFIKGRYEKK